ncbi:hypothetical protein [Pontibacter roseus]|uniref:hypothetical protein n=1 Tax=Pontibacter roseus TaxID=336989 RepID=UPI00035FED73|nr:hypothetical protein [Pontibacter roseus]
MRKIGIVSALIGITGLILVTYYTYQFNLNQQELGELQDTVTPYFMGATSRMVLAIGETAGAVLGFVSYRRYRQKIGLFGMGICILTLIFLYPF